MAKKVMVIGLDAAAPQLLFERWRNSLPNLNKLMKTGSFGPLESSDPPITCPAWMSMMTGKDAGSLGFYGFRNRKNYSYQELSFVNSRWVKDDKVWDILNESGKKSILLGVPQTYPPQELNGIMVSGFLTPGLKYDYTYPAIVKEEIKEAVGDYIFDVDRGDQDEELEQIYQMTEKRFKLAEHFLDTREWDFFMMVEMGIDRIQHFFWEYFDQDHPSYQLDNKYEKAVYDYYKYVDEKIGRLLRYVDQDTLLLIVSDHGAQKMTGGFAINEWLIEKGYLVLREDLEGVTPIEMAKIDWKRTKAWGYGGYYGRIFLNVAGREPMGVIPLGDYDKFRDRLITELEEIELEDENINGDKSEATYLKNQVYKPEEIYTEINNIAPDLMVYFNDLEWRSIGNLGFDSYIIPSNKLQPYSANHTKEGICISNKKINRQNDNYIEGLDIREIASTVIGYLGIDIPADMQGKNIFD